MKQWEFTTKTNLIIAVGAATLLVMLALWSPWHSNGSSTAPTFSSVTPRNTDIKALGGWQKLTPPDGSSVYIYSDTIDGIAVSVSQQSLPKSFKTNVAAKVAEMAKGYNATTEIPAHGTKAYIGTSGDGPQSVLFTKNDVLILIKSRAVVANDSWSAYINSLN